MYHDPAERNERLREWLSPWEDWRCEAEDSSSTAITWWRSPLPRDAARAAARSWTTGRAPLALRDGKAIRLVVYADRAKALAAAGL